MKLVLNTYITIIASTIVAICSTNIPYAVNSSNNINRVFVVVEDTMPSYAGKTMELDEKQKKWVFKHLKYPKEAQEKNIQGRVTVQFVVETDGSISNVKVARSVHPLLDEEAVRVIKSMPKFKPIMEDGKPVKEQFMMVVPFKLSY